MKKILGNLTAMAALAVVALAIAPNARADVIDFYLTTVEGGGTISQSSAVEVIVDELTSTTATVEFIGPGTSNVNAPVAINVGGYFDASSTEGLAPMSPCGYALTACATGNTNSLGSFDVETGAAGNHTITIDLTAENGTNWADAAAVLSPNSDGFEALEGGAGAQDAGDYSTPVPEPTSLTLFGTALAALAGLGALRRRRARRGSAA